MCIDVDDDEACKTHTHTQTKRAYKQKFKTKKITKTKKNKIIIIKRQTNIINFWAKVKQRIENGILFSGTVCQLPMWATREEQK